MSISLEVGGMRYYDFTAVTVERALDQISGTFTFEAVTSPEDPFPIPRGEACAVYVNDTVVMTGFVDIIEVDYNYSTHTISIQGRDKTADIVDSMLDGKLEFKAPITLDEVVQKTLDDIEASDVQVKNQVPGLAPYTKKELVSGKIGMGAFEFMDRYASKRQVILTTDGEGNIVITRASEELTDIVFRNIIADRNNNIQSAQVKFDDSERYNQYKFYAQDNHAADPNSPDTPAKGAHYSSEYTDPNIRASRKYRAIGEGSQGEDKLMDRATWEGNIREAKSFLYTVTMAGHSPYSHDGEPYQPNTLVTVEDEFADVFADLLIVRVTHRLDLTSGSTTELEMMTRGAYLLLKQEANKSDESAAGAGDKKKSNTPDNSKYANVDTSGSEYFAPIKTK